MTSHVNLRHYPPAFGKFMASVFLEVRDVSSAPFMKLFLSQQNVEINKYQHIYIYIMYIRFLIYMYEYRNQESYLAVDSRFETFMANTRIEKIT